MSEFLSEYYQQSFGGGERSVSMDAGVAQASATGGQDGGMTMRDLQRGSTVFSSLLGIATGAGRASDMQRQAGDEQIAAIAEETDGSRRATEILRQQIQASARMRAAFAASGVDPASASVRQLDREGRDRASEALTDVRHRAGYRSAARRSRATALARRAAETFGGSVLTAGVNIFETAVDNAGRVIAGGSGG
tara:strand:- start:438 stop:1016 length:579 start_codon:yes stop_codon:yes gene_type:complete